MIRFLMLLVLKVKVLSITSETELPYFEQNSRDQLKGNLWSVVLQ